MELETLYNKSLRIAINKIVSPGYTHVVANEGMPISKAGQQLKGNLLIEFDIMFPKRLSESQKKVINDCLEN